MNARLFLTCGKKGGLIHEVFQVSSRKSAACLGHIRKAYIVGEGFVLSIDAQNILSSLNVRQTHVNLAVKTTGTQQGGV
ncbi:hypothetical protein SDC9_179782 [bioreactor metagenome]|uniref:Uncharacterized protein n=1 Tax=bioreactor metagenome TaxID=1076179 RepID=A0A645H7Q2_9ZZZZ